ncbi:MAG TPA: hypothetical protein VE029_06395 [Rhizobacter sp.]|nr:hypothetical protein [Rhizobacter sp.]
MTISSTARWLCFSAALGLAGAPACADSFASSASEGISASVGSVSDSFGASSDSSSKKDKKAAAGDYQVIEVALVEQRPGSVRLKLQPLADATEDRAVFLYLPQQAFDAHQIAVGQTVSARTRPYGMEFAKADTGRAFFLVLEDAWYRELQSRQVRL